MQKITPCLWFKGNGGPAGFSFNESFSLSVDCEDQEK